MDHFSASQISLFLDEPALWLLRRFYGITAEVGPAAWRGSAIEAAMDLRLYKRGCSDEECLEKAMERFELDAQGILDDDHEKARQEIPLFLANLLPSLKDWPEPLARQMRIEWWPDGCGIPVIGYADYVFEDGIVDLKTTARMPSFDTSTGQIKQKGDHLRQMAIYRASTDKPCTLLYVTPGKAKEPIRYQVSDEEHSAALRQVTAAVKAMERLNRQSDPKRIIDLFPPRDLAGFRWDAPSRAKACELWGL